MLDILGLSGPAVVVGHSIAGFYVEGFARLFPRSGGGGCSSSIPVPRRSRNVFSPPRPAADRLPSRRGFVQHHRAPTTPRYDDAQNPQPVRAAERVVRSHSRMGAEDLPRASLSGSGDDRIRRVHRYGAGAHRFTTLEQASTARHRPQRRCCTHWPHHSLVHRLDGKAAETRHLPRREFSRPAPGASPRDDRSTRGVGELDSAPHAAEPSGDDT